MPFHSAYIFMYLMLNKKKKSISSRITCSDTKINHLIADINIFYLLRANKGGKSLLSAMCWILILTSWQLLFLPSYWLWIQNSSITSTNSGKMNLNNLIHISLLAIAPPHKHILADAECLPCAGIITVGRSCGLAERQNCDVACSLTWHSFLPIELMETLGRSH